jgi:PAS domain S-box-containing protein
MAEEVFGADATFVVGSLGRFEDVDDGACRLLGYSRKELLGLHGSELIVPEERPTVAASIDRMRRGTLDWRRGRLMRKDGSLVPIEVGARPLGQGRVELKVWRLVS